MHFALGLPLLSMLAWPVSASSDIAYCSSVNTGSGNSANSSIYQSNGLCEETCNSDYAFGILLDKVCWCSNIAPNEATNVNTSECDDGCPGYPSDYCGNESKSLYAYIEMSLHMPSGTATVSSSATSTGTSSSSSDSTTGGSTTTGHTVSVHTVAGVVETVTVANSGSTSSADVSNKSSDSGSSGLSKGALAGVVVGSIAGCIGIAILIFLVCAAKRRTRASSPDPSVQNILLDGRQSKGSQMSFMKGVFSDNHSHTLSAGSSNTPQRMPTFSDSRMKTDAPLYANNRNSSVSLQDNEDYSRPVLRLTNPD